MRIKPGSAKWILIIMLDDKLMFVILAATDAWSRETTAKIKSPLSCVDIERCHRSHGYIRWSCIIPSIAEIRNHSRVAQHELQLCHCFLHIRIWLAIRSVSVSLIAHNSWWMQIVESIHSMVHNLSFFSMFRTKNMIIGTCSQCDTFLLASELHSDKAGSFSN